MRTQCENIVWRVLVTIFYSLRVLIFILMFLIIVLIFCITGLLGLLKQPIHPEYPHSHVWRVLVTFVFLVTAVFLCITGKMNSIIIEDLMAPWAICSLWVLIIYLSVILWLPFRNIWECIERVEYTAIKEDDFRQKISGSLNVVSTLVALSIAFIVLSLSIILPIISDPEQFTPIQWNVIKLVMGSLVAGVIFLVVTMEAYGVRLNPAFASAQIARLYTRGWWFYTFGLYSIVIALLLYVYLLEPLITIIGVIIFIVTFTIFLRTPCDIKSGYQNRRIDK